MRGTLEAAMRGETVLVNGEPVGNVLVEPGGHVDEESIIVPTGTTVAYTLRFPIAYDGPISDAVVTVRGLDCRTVGHSDHYAPQAVFGSWGVDWDMTVLVTRVAGDMTASIEVVEVIAEVDALGYPSRSESTVYSGMAQARMGTGIEKAGSTAEVATSETWHFVVPWQAAFASLRPQSAYVLYGGARYDVSYVMNVGNASRFCDFEAVRRG